MKYLDYVEDKLNECKDDLAENEPIFDEYEIVVSSERILNAPKKNNVIYFIVKELSGTYVFGTAEQPSVTSTPVQIIGYSELNSFNILKQILDLFTMTHQNESFYDGTNLIKQTYSTVTALRTINDAYEGFKASFYTYGQYITCVGLSDIRHLVYKYDATHTELINYTTAVFSYAAVLNTTKISGQQLSTSETQEAGLVFTMTIMSNNSHLSKKVNNIMIGAASNNTEFEFLFNYGWETAQTAAHSLKMRLSNAVLSTNRTDAPSLELTFAL